MRSGTLALILAALAVACVSATTEPLIEAKSGDIRLVTRPSSDGTDYDVLFVFAEDDVRSARGIYDQLDDLRTSVISAQSTAISSSQSSLSAAVASINSDMSVTRSLLSTSVSSARDAASASVALARSEASTATAQVSTAAVAYTDVRVASAEDNASKAAAALVMSAMAANPGTNGTVVDLVNSLLRFQETASNLIEDLQFQVDVLEDLVPDRPQTCKDIAVLFSHVPQLRSQVYDIYPNNTRVQAFCQHQLITPGQANIAFGKNTAQSSVTNNGFAYKAVDGNDNNVFSGGSCTHTDNELVKWWVVDLGAEYIIEQVDIIGRGDCCWDRLNGMSVRLGTKWGDDRGANDPECTPGISYAFTSAAPTRSISCSNRVSAQYVSVRVVTPSLVATTLCEVKVYGKVNENVDGWTLIASQPGEPLDNVRTWYSRPAPTMTTAGVLEYFWKVDLKTIASEIYVENQAGESYIFKTSDFSGPLILDGPNFVDAGDNINHGIIAGNNFPVINHYQVSQACGSFGPNCRVGTGIDTGRAYSFGLLAVFDWSEGDGSTSIAYHAHFGGTRNLESGWSRRGKYIMIR